MGRAGDVLLLWILGYYRRVSMSFIQCYYGRVGTVWTYSSIDVVFIFVRLGSRVPWVISWSIIFGPPPGQNAADAEGGFVQNEYRPTAQV